ncbi:metallophosphoesterase family protein [Paenibacillus hodogayensis]|uniref:Metallophosphoesterase family protein n=1 Tax=Paenibacillus hodogayensis TaxID=279208 RepID=A0ABV5W886_9BACL
MSRRQFIKWLLSLAALCAATFAGWRFWLRREPAGTSEPNDSGTAVAPSGSSEGSERPAPLADGSLLGVMILSDTHVNSGFEEQSDKLRKALDDTSRFDSRIDALLITGDITDAGTDADYREYANVMKAYKKLPAVHANMGNHDYYGIWIDKDGQWSKDSMPNGKSDEHSRRAFMSQFGLERTYHDFYVNGFHFIMLSQEAYVQEKPEVGEGAWYSDEQLAWFKKALEPHKDGSPVFVMIHQPLPAIGQDGGSHQLIRAQAFRSLLKPYANVFVFSGHRHQNFRSGEHYSKETFHWFQNASVGRTRPVQQGDNTPTAQGLYVQVYADKVVLRAREFMDRTWIAEGSWTIPLKR